MLLGFFQLLVPTSPKALEHTATREREEKERMKMAHPFLFLKKSRVPHITSLTFQWLGPVTSPQPGAGKLVIKCPAGCYMTQKKPQNVSAL